MVQSSFLKNSQNREITACLVGTVRTNICINCKTGGRISQNESRSMYSTIQTAKKPAIIAKIAATPSPPFVTKEVAADEVVGDEAAELACEALVGTELVGFPVLEAFGVEPEAPEDAGALDAKDDAPLLAEPLALAELAGVVNETGRGDGVGPVGAREAAAHVSVCIASAAAISAGEQCRVIQAAASTWN